ncbi:CapA family protein [Rhodococcus koreensis]
MKTEIVGTGDSILTRNLTAVQHPGFTELVNLIRGADVSFTNLENVFPGPRRSPATTYHGTHLGVRQDLLDEFTWMGFDVYGMANNHATDYGTAGLVDSMDELHRRNMPFAGVGHTLREARRPVYVQTGSARVALIAAGSSNARLAAAADPGEADDGRPGLAPIRLQRTHHVEQGKFEALRQLLSETGVNVTPSGTTAPGVFLPYPDRNMWDGPPAGGFALEGIHFAPAQTSRIDFTVLQRDADALVAAVDEAQRQADLVLVALHCHEGAGGTWNTDTPADFLRPLAHSLIDAGAHAILGSGPHMLRGIELYRGKPICYSLGNFIFTLETLDALPIEVYEQAGLPKDSTVADFYDRITGYATRKEFWETIVPRFQFEDGELVASELVPVTLGYGQSRAQRGCPVIASEKDGRDILERLTTLSSDLGTSIEITSSDHGVVGRLEL